MKNQLNLRKPNAETSPPAVEKSVEEPTQPEETKPAETSPQVDEKSVEEPTQPEKTKPAETSPPAAEKSVEEPTQPEETNLRKATKEKKTDEDSNKTKIKTIFQLELMLKSTTL